MIFTMNSFLIIKIFHNIKYYSSLLHELKTSVVFQKADILGYPTHADFILDMRMAKTQKAVAQFLSELKDKLQPLKGEEMKLFLEYKKEDVSVNDLELR